jgi:pheromone a factor receptor
MPPTFFLFYIWPLAIGCVSVVYAGGCPPLYCALYYRGSCATALTIYSFIKREHQFSQIMSSNINLNRSRYFRLIVLSSLEILGTVPLSIYWIVYNVRLGVQPWVSWDDTHSNFSRVPQVASVIWKNNHTFVVGLEGFRWSLVACAFVFFGFFGFADEARQHYRLVYTSLASRIGLTTSITLHGSSHAYVTLFNYAAIPRTQFSHVFSLARRLSLT